MNDQDAIRFLIDGIEEYVPLHPDHPYADTPAPDLARQRVRL